MAEQIRNKKYPFESGEDLKNSGLSDIDASFNMENMNTGLLLSVIKLKEVISEDVFTAIMAHYNSDAFQKEEPTAEETKLDELVKNMQFALASFGFLETFVWRRLRVSNNSITVSKSKDEDRPYKFDLDEAKNNLFRIGWTFTTELIQLLNANIPTGEGETVFHKWAASKQYTTMQSLIIRDYKDFNEHYYIDSNAAFFIRAMGMQQRVIEEDINSRIQIIWETIPAEGETAEVPKTSDKIIKLVKSYVAHAVMAKACFTMDAYYLPDSVRNLLENEHFKKKDNNTTFVKEKLSRNIAFEAEKILHNLDMELASLEEQEEGETYLTEFEEEIEPDDKFYFPC